MRDCVQPRVPRRTLRPAYSNTSVSASQATVADRTKDCSKVDYINKVEAKRFDGNWTSFVGNWYVNLHDASKMATMTAMRCFKYADEGRTQLQQINVYPRRHSPSSKPREHDKLFDARFTYDAVDPAAAQAPLNVRTHHPATPEMVAIGDVDREAYARVHLSVPGSPAATSAMAHLAAQGQHSYQYMLVELFLADGDYRWSLCASYEVQAPGAPLSLVNLAQERLTRLDPEEADVINAHLHLAPDVRPRLDTDPTKWTPLASTGVISSIEVDPETGNLVYTEPQEASFVPPPTADTPTHRFIPLEDAMYALVPKGAGGAQGGAGEEFWVEFGGVMRRDERFERLRVAYAADGALQGVLREVYG